MLSAKDAKKLADAAKKRRLDAEIARRRDAAANKSRAAADRKLNARFHALQRKVYSAIRNEVLSAAFEGRQSIYLQPNDREIHTKLDWCERQGFPVEIIGLGTFMEVALQSLDKKELNDLFISIRNLVNDCIDGLIHQPISDESLFKLKETFDQFNKFSDLNRLRNFLNGAWGIFSAGYRWLQEDDTQKQWARTWAEKLPHLQVHDQPLLDVLRNISYEDGDTIFYNIRWDTLADSAFNKRDWVHIESMNWLSGEQGREFIGLIERAITQQASLGLRTIKVNFTLAHNRFKYTFGRTSTTIPCSISFKDLIHKAGYKCVVVIDKRTAESRRHSSHFVVSW